MKGPGGIWQDELQCSTQRGIPVLLPVAVLSKRCITILSLDGCMEVAVALWLRRCLQ